MKQLKWHESLTRWSALIFVPVITAQATSLSTQLPIETFLSLIGIHGLQLLMIGPGSWRRRLIVFVAILAEFTIAQWLPDPTLSFAVCSLALLLAGPLNHSIAATILLNFVYLVALDSGVLYWLNDAYAIPLANGISSFFHRRDIQSPLTTLGSWPLVALTQAIYRQRAVHRSRNTGIAIAVSVLLISILVFTSVGLGSAIPLVLLIIMIEFRSVSQVTQGAAERRTKAASALLALLILVGTCISIGADAPSGFHRPAVVAFVPIGLGTQIVEAGPPLAENRKLQAEFGQLPNFLRRQGSTVSILEYPLTKESLKLVDCLLVINPTRRPTGEEVRAIYGRVSEGMTLVLAGDHTNISGLRSPCNDYLRPADIQLNFDSAIPDQGAEAWHKSLWVAPKIKWSLPRNCSIGISVGASLSLGPRAQPLIVGQRGYSDSGNKENPPGFLGDMQFGLNERSGDVILAAHCEIGSGRVIAFGDTSTFQDGAIPQSAPVILSLLETRTTVNLSLATKTILMIALLLFVAVITFEPILIIAIVIAASMCTLALRLVGPHVQRELTYNESVVLANDFLSPYPGPFPEQHIDKLTWVLGMKGRLLFVGQVEKAIRENASGIIVLAPLTPIGRSTVDRLHGFVDRGGSLYIFSSGTYRDNTEVLLARFGFSISQSPLGGRGETQISDASLRSVIDSIKSSSADTLLDAYEVVGVGNVLARTLGRPTLLRKRVGKGQVLVSGDARWITDEGMGALLNVNVRTARLAYEVLN